MAEFNVLVVGSGGREYELARQLAGSQKVSKVYVAPGNAGTATLDKVENAALDPTDAAAAVTFAHEQGVSLTVIGPEAPLIAGLADAFRTAGIAAFGPSRRAAQLEASKAFASDFMTRYDIPQPNSRIAHSLDEALAVIEDKPADSYVLKASGLAGGKGVVLPASTEEAAAVLGDMFSGKGFDGAGKDTVVIQERLHGPEVSAFAVSDGEHFILLPFAQDHKRLKDNDEGPNTGGMGAYAPLPESIVSPETAQKIRAIAEQTFRGMAQDGTPYQGVLFIGLMLAAERNGDPVVIEYNVRFGDPETEVLLPTLSESGFDVADMLIKCAHGDISGITEPAAYTKTALTVCLAASGYPESPRKGDTIEGLGTAYDGVIVHHAGTKQNGNDIVTSGGRVLYVTGFGDTPDKAAAKAYAAIGENGVHFSGMQYRTDIGHQIRTK